MPVEAEAPAGKLTLIEGVIVRSQSGFFVVHTGRADFTCRLRGKLKQQKQDQTKGDVVAVGDRVLVSLQSEKTGSIEEVLPRHSAFSRSKVIGRYLIPYQEILLANPDQVVLVFACARPEPHLRMLDRFLVIAESQKIPVLIVANKVDLIPLTDAKRLFRVYEQLGYPVLFASARTLEGIPALRNILEGKLSVLFGPSGVGKSSLLNAIQPGLGLEVRAISQATGKGSHTTQVRELFPLEPGGYVADMPGIRTLALWDITPEELDGYFPEIRTIVHQCQFNDCTHSHEPGCAVVRAVKAGAIDPGRYQSYMRLRFEGAINEDLEADEDTVGSD